MRIVQAEAHIIDPIDRDAVLKKLERCGRICYKSEGKATEDSAEGFIRRLIKRGHESVLEHVSVTAHFICDRGVSHEIVRHRIASYSQESTRYCNYSKDGFGSEITLIAPMYLRPETSDWYSWLHGCWEAEQTYFRLLEAGRSPQEARAVLPNSLKTELMMTANLREWRHFFRLRCSPAAHPQMREVANMLLDEFKAKLPVIFEDFGGTDNVTD